MDTIESGDLSVEGPKLYYLPLQYREDKEFFLIKVTVRKQGVRSLRPQV